MISYRSVHAQTPQPEVAPLPAAEHTTTLPEDESEG